MSQEPQTSTNAQQDKEKDKPTQINKYSIYELKSGMDTAIIDFLDKNQFQENYNNAITKIILGTLCLSFTGVAYLYPKPFPQNYNIVLVCVIGYFFFSFIYYLFETYVIKNTFYVGNNLKYLGKKCGRNANRIKNFKLNSDIKPLSSVYDFWIDIVTIDGRKIQGEKENIDCVEFFDERGHIQKEKVVERFEKILVNNVQRIYSTLG